MAPLNEVNHVPGKHGFGSGRGGSQEDPGDPEFSHGDGHEPLGWPTPPPAWRSTGKKLADNTYQVLVVGEAKRGKSTFVNALIGRDILPTDVDIATSQVFRVCPRGAAKPIACASRTIRSRRSPLADLPRYGSQVVADADGVPRLDQIIRWIEVDVPARFLPANVRILDTPGLGALYAAHAQITHRFVPHADAVLFILDSQAPIGEPEIQFVDQAPGGDAQHLLRPDEDRPVPPGSLAGDPEAEPGDPEEAIRGPLGGHAGLADLQHQPAQGRPDRR